MEETIRLQPDIRLPPSEAKRLRKALIEAETNLGALVTALVEEWLEEWPVLPQARHSRPRFGAEQE